MRSTAALSVAAAAVAALVLTGCGGGDGGQDDGTVELTFRQFDPPNQIAGLEAAVEAWNDANPDIQVTLETLTDPEGAKQFAREANSGSGPDVVQIANANAVDLANPNILLPLDDFLGDASSEVAIDDYLALDMVQFDDATWALPWTVDTFTLVYDPAVIDEAGTQLPETWEDLPAVGAALTTDDRAGFCFPAGSGAGSGQWFLINYYLWSHDVTLVEDEGGTWVVGANQADLSGAIDFFAGLLESGTTPAALAAVDGLTDPQIADATANGSCAMTLMAPQTFRNARTINDALQTAPMPDGLVEGHTHLGGRALGINASTEHPEEAWKFIQFLNSPEAFASIGQYPASTTLLESLDVPDGEEGYQEQLPFSQSFGRYTAGPVPVSTLQKIVNAQFGAVYSGQTDSASAAQEIINQIQAELDRQ